MFNLRPAIFCDRDGVLNELIADGEPGNPESYLHEWKQFHWCDGVMEALEIAYTELDYELFVVSNQSGISRYPDKMPYESISKLFTKMFLEIDKEVRSAILCNAAIPNYPQVALPDDIGDKKPSVEEQHVLTDIIFCPHLPDAGCCCRKPKPGMLYFLAFRWGIDLKRSWMIGDSDSDMKAGWNAGIRKLIRITPEAEPFEESKTLRWMFRFNTSEGIHMRSLLDAIKFIKRYDSTEGNKK